jgi:hypothetical protein
MTDKFILLTTTEDKPVIIGTSNIALIETEKSLSNDKVKVTMNFSRGKDMIPKLFYVKESFEQIKSMLGI